MTHLARVNVPAPLLPGVLTAAQLVLAYVVTLTDNPVALFDADEFLTVLETAFLAGLGGVVAVVFVWFRERLGEPTSVIIRMAYTALEAIIPIAAVVSFGTWADVITFGQSATAAALAAVLSLATSAVNGRLSAPISV